MMVDVQRNAGATAARRWQFAVSSAGQGGNSDLRTAGNLAGVG